MGFASEIFSERLRHVLGGSPYAKLSDMRVVGMNSAVS